ncbi:MAG: sulfatase [Planctomycetota bacterium]|jgi:arylsulfatase A-like enzyme
MRILHVDIDTTRADHLGCYGYSRNTSPNLDRIAADGVRFEHCYAPDAPCLPSRAALFMGRFGIHTGVVNHGGLCADPYPEGPGREFLTDPRFASWPAAMREAGLRTVTVSPFAERHSAWWFYAGFAEMHDTGKHGGEIADDVVPIALEWLKSNGSEDNWYLHVNVWDPHTPYRTPLEHGYPFADDPPPAWMTDEIIAQHRASYGPNSASEVRNYWDLTDSKFQREPKQMLSTADFKQWIDAYDTGIHYADMWAGRLFAMLEELSVMEETAILISSDHGENQGELNVYGDHHTADSITSRVPCILKWPGLKPGVETGLHYQGDVAATILQLLGQDIPERWDWRGCADSLKTGGATGRDYLVISQCAWSCQRSVRWEKWLMMRTYDTGLKAFPSVMLFDIDADPHLQHNVADGNADIVARMQAMLDEWHADMMESADRGPDPMEHVLAEGGPYHTRTSLEMYATRLRETGRAHHADFLEAHGGKPVDLA